MSSPEPPGRFYRVCLTDPPTLDDFRSEQARGRRPRDDRPETMRLWSGVSVYDAYLRARRKTESLGRVLGEYVAELEIPPGTAVRVERTMRSSGHYTLWGDPETLRALIVSVERV